MKTLGDKTGKIGEKSNFDEIIALILVDFGHFMISLTLT